MKTTNKKTTTAASTKQGSELVQMTNISECLGRKIPGAYWTLDYKYEISRGSAGWNISEVDRHGGYWVLTALPTLKEAKRDLTVLIAETAEAEAKAQAEHEALLAAAKAQAAQAPEEVKAAAVAAARASHNAAAAKVDSKAWYKVVIVDAAQALTTTKTVNGSDLVKLYKAAAALEDTVLDITAALTDKPSKAQPSKASKADNGKPKRTTKPSPKKEGLKVEHIAEQMELELMPAAQGIDLLARYAVNGTCRRVFEKSGNQRIKSLQIDAMKAIQLMDNAAAALEGDYKPNFDKQGNHKPSTYNAADVSTLDKYAVESLGVGIDLYTAAYEAIATAWKAGHGILDIIETSAKGKERNVFQVACVAVRREIMSHTALENNGKTLYLEDMEGELVKLPRYWDLGGIDSLFTGTAGTYTASLEAYDKVLEMLEALDLTKAQRLPVNYRLKGLSIHQTAERLGISQQGAQKHLALARAKFLAVYGENLTRDNKGVYSWVHQVITED